ncbi:MAG: hypothetical protein MZU79_06915 [Anaerotruncus sp.]|nr:hypothetical protein [Anaerotruncus sp.]
MTGEEWPRILAMTSAYEPCWPAVWPGAPVLLSPPAQDMIIGLDQDPFLVFPLESSPDPFAPGRCPSPPAGRDHPRG